MKTRIAWTLFAATLAALLWVGCDDEDPSTDPRRWWNDPVTIQIVTGAMNDTLWYVPGDSTSTTVTIIVTDYHGNAYSGAHVDISLANATLGVIEYVDEALRDTTNAQGRVNAVFRSFAQPGDQIISATANGRTSYRILAIRPRSQGVATVTFQTDCDSIIAEPDGPDSCEICVTLRDADYRPIEGVAPNFTATGGRLIIPPATDSTGRSCFYWHFRDENFGRYCLYVAADSICFEIPD